MSSIPEAKLEKVVARWQAVQAELARLPSIYQGVMGLNSERQEKSPGSAHFTPDNSWH